MKHLLALLCLVAALFTAAPARCESIAGTVSGKVQKVGFRAFVLRQAIAQNLAGWVLNLPDGRISFSLYGPQDRIKEALKKIKEGPDESDVNAVQTWPVADQPGLKTFTVYGWTSESRDIHVPRDLVFEKRPDDSVVDGHKAKKVYHDILRAAGVDEP